MIQNKQATQWEKNLRKYKLLSLFFLLHHLPKKKKKIEEERGACSNDNHDPYYEMSNNIGDLCQFDFIFYHLLTTLTYLPSFVLKSTVGYTHKKKT